MPLMQEVHLMWVTAKGPNCASRGAAASDVTMLTEGPSKPRVRKCARQQRAEFEQTQKASGQAASAAPSHVNHSVG